MSTGPMVIWTEVRLIYKLVTPFYFTTIQEHVLLFSEEKALPF